MADKLGEEKKMQILRTGIAEFGKKGPDGAAINAIARKAGVSIGVLYKYYGDKKGFFEACVTHSLSRLPEIIEDAEVSAAGGERGPGEWMRELIRSALRFSREYPDDIRLYHQITLSARDGMADWLAGEIESISAQTYAEIMRREQALGRARTDIDPRLMAYFFDNILMMLQFIGGSEYYQKRMEIYLGTGEAAGGKEEAEKRIEEAFLKLLTGAFQNRTEGEPEGRTGP